MRKLISVLVVLQMLWIPITTYAAPNNEKTKVSLTATDSKPEAPKKSQKSEADVYDPASYRLVEKGRIATTLFDNFGTTHTIYYSDISEVYPEMLEIQFYYKSNDPYTKEPILTIEQFYEVNQTLRFEGSNYYVTSGYTDAFLSTVVDKHMYSNQPFIYFRVGTSATVEDEYYSSVEMFKIRNPYYEEDDSSKGDTYVVINNESISENTEHTGTFHYYSQMKNNTIDPTLDQSSYLMDADIPFDIPEITGSPIEKNTYFTAQNETVGDTRFFWVTNLGNNIDYHIQARLAYSGSKSNVWVYNNQITDFAAAQLGTEFDENIYGAVTSHFAQESDVDRNGKVHILVYDIQDGYNGSGGYTSGYFYGRDLYSKNYFPHSNQGEIFYIDTYPSMGTVGAPLDVTRSYGTLAHEFQHMVSFNQNVLVEGNEDLPSWMDEGLAEAAHQIYRGIGLSGRLDYYNRSNSIQNGHSLLYWGDNNDSLSNYSLSYLFMQYLKIQTGQGDRLFKEIIHDEYNDYQVIEKVAKKYIDPNMTFGELMTNFRMALLLKEPTGLYGFKGDPFFDQLQEKIYTGGPTYLRGGAAVVMTDDSADGLDIPSDKGPSISYTFVDKKQGGNEDTQAPERPLANGISNTDTEIVGSTEANITVFAKVGSTEIGRTVSNQVGYFTIQIPVQSAGTIVDVYAEDASGNVSEPATLQVYDIVPPEPPIVDEVNIQDTFVSGQAEPGVKIEVSIFQEVIGSGVASEGGSFLIEIPAQPAGTPLYVSAIDDSGNRSSATLVIVRDYEKPSPPIVNEVTDQDTVITGQAEKDSTITVKTNGILFGTTTANSEGYFSFTIPKIIAGTTISITATDNSGNVSDPTNIIVKDVTPPEKPIVYDVTDQDSVISGVAEGGARIEVKVNGMVIGSDVSNSYGIFSFPIEVQPAGTTLYVTATDTNGNVSEVTTVIVKDMQAPTKPVVNEVSDQDTVISGQTEAGALVEVKVDNNTLGSGEAKADGTFSIAIPKQPAGTTLSITATDTNGNVSEVSTVIVIDKTAPTKPVVNEVTDQDTVVTGQTEAGAFVEVKVDGNRLGSGEAKVDGTFSIAIPKQPAETTLGITASDTNGNVSEATVITVKQVKKYGWSFENNKWFYYDLTSGNLQKGWLQDKGIWYYFNQQGIMQTGWIIDNGSWYYMNPSGAMQTGWLYLGGTWYFMNGSGAMLTGWGQVGSTWYYFASSGAMQTGWVFDGQSWYYMNTGGAMQTGWAQVSSTWYYFANSGAMKTGWLYDGWSWYYMDAGGAMRTDWVLIGGQWYYFNGSGVWLY